MSAARARPKKLDNSSSLSATAYSSESADGLQLDLNVLTDKWESKRFKAASGVMKGWRPSMEDRHAVNMTLVKARGSKKKAARHGAAFFGVFDGHGGHEVSHMLQTEVPRRMKTMLAKEKRVSKRAIKKAFRQTYLGIDKELISGKLSTGRDHFAGSTATCAVVTDDHIIVGHVGDSRAIASVGGKMVALTEDHKPNDPEETRRAKAAGQEVWMRSLLGMDQWRVGPLAMSRSVGDILLKKNAKLPQEQQAVVATPSFEEISTKNVDFLLLGSDGVFEVMENEGIHDFVSERLADGMDLAKVCEELEHTCVSRNPNKREQFLGRDNMTVVLVRFLNNAKQQEESELNQLATDLLKRRKKSGSSSSSGATARQNVRRTIVATSHSSFSNRSANSGGNSARSGGSTRSGGSGGCSTFSGNSVPSSTRSSWSKSKSKSDSSS